MDVSGSPTIPVSVRSRAFVGPENTPTGRVYSFAWWPVVATSAAVAAVHLAGALLSKGYWLDEAYMLAIGRGHLEWGSADQPPLAPALAGLMDLIAPGNVLVLRLPVIAAAAAAVVVAAVIARELGGDRRAQLLTALAQATGLFTSLTGHWTTPYGFESLEWLTLFWLLTRWLRTREDKLLLALGVVAGVALMTKFQVGLLAFVLLASIALFGPRTLLGRPRLWIAGLWALLIALPTLYWQASHGWPQLAMGPVVAGEVETVYGGRPALAWQLLGFGGPLAAGLVLAGLWWLFRDPVWRPYRFLGITYAVLYLFFVITAGRSYYLLGYIGVLAAVGAVGFAQRRAASDTIRRWPAWVSGSLSAVLALGVVGVSTVLTPEATVKQLPLQVADIYHHLPEHEHVAVVGQSYVLAAYIDAYAPQFGLPPAHSTNRGYGYFAPPPERDTDVLYIGGDPRELTTYFHSVTRVSGDNDTTIWLLTGRIKPWKTFWPGLRHLTIGASGISRDCPMIGETGVVQSEPGALQPSRPAAGSGPGGSTRWRGSRT